MSLRQYEIMIILDPEIEERTVAPSLDKYLSVIKTDGGTVDKVDIWGRRRLAYDIKKKSEASTPWWTSPPRRRPPRSWTVSWASTRSCCGPRCCAPTPEAHVGAGA